MSIRPDESRTVPIQLLLPPRNDREVRDEVLMQKLASSIQKEGVLQPVRCVPECIDGTEYYRVITGWTRVLSSRRAGLSDVPAIVIRRPISESDDLIQKLTENDLRGATSLPDRIRWYLKLMELNRDWSQGDLAKAVHSTPVEVSKTLRISSSLAAELVELVGEGEGKLPVSCAYAIARLEDPAQQRELANLVINGRLKRDACENEVTRRLRTNRKCAKPLKLKCKAALAIIPGEWSWDEVVEWLAKLAEAARKGAKHGLPVSSLQTLLG